MQTRTCDQDARRKRAWWVESLQRDDDAAAKCAQKKCNTRWGASHCQCSAQDNEGMHECYMSLSTEVEEQ